LRRKPSARPTQPRDSRRAACSPAQREPGDVAVDRVVRVVGEVREKPTFGRSAGTAFHPPHPHLAHPGPRVSRLHDHR
jgi:hypothetical protein